MEMNRDLLKEALQAAGKRGLVAFINPLDDVMDCVLDHLNPPEPAPLVTREMYEVEWRPTMQSGLELANKLARLAVEARLERLPNRIGTLTPRQVQIGGQWVDDASLRRALGL